MEGVIAGSAIIGIINAIQKQFPKVAGLGGILLAVVLGGLAGYFQVGGVDTVQNGVIVGLASSGVFKLATKIGG